MPATCPLGQPFEENVVQRFVSPKLAELDMGQGPGDLHVLDYTLFFYNVRKNVAERVAAFVGRRPRL